jgi:tetratricopeptide (TPR) repeat protein
VDQAHRLVADSLQLANSTGSMLGILNAIENLAQFYTMEGEYEAGLHFLEEQSAAARRVQDALRIGTIDTLRAHLLGELGQYEAAISLAEGSLKAAAALSAHAQIRTLSVLGRQYAELRDFSQAHQSLDQALRLAGEGKPSAQIMPILGSLYLAVLEGTQPILRSAEATAQQVIAQLRGTEWRMELADALSLLAGLHLKLADFDDRQSHLEQALACTAESLQLFTPLPRMPRQPLYLHYLALRGLDRPAEALDFLQHAYLQVTSIADRIQDPAYRKSWQDQVWINRDILSTWSRQQEQGLDANQPDGAGPGLVAQE